MALPWQRKSEKTKSDKSDKKPENEQNTATMPRPRGRPRTTGDSK